MAHLISDGSREERIETTIGDLIFAITEAAREAQIREEDVPPLAHTILMNMLRRAQQEV